MCLPREATLPVVSLVSEDELVASMDDWAFGFESAGSSRQTLAVVSRRTPIEYLSRYSASCSPSITSMGSTARPGGRPVAFNGDQLVELLDPGR